MIAKRFTVKLTPDDIAEATAVGRHRQDIRTALAEKAAATGLHRPWDGNFMRAPTWKIWSRLGHPITALSVKTSDHAHGGLPVYGDDSDENPLLLVLDHDAPVFVLAGWMFGKDAKKEQYSNPSGGFLVPQNELRPPWQLKKEPRSKGRLNQNDPADDFAGHGPYPGMLDSDDGQHAQAYGVPSPARFALPCRRCRTVVPVGVLTVWSLRTGWIHAETAECKAGRKRRN